MSTPAQSQPRAAPTPSVQPETIDLYVRAHRPSPEILNQSAEENQHLVITIRTVTMASTVTEICVIHLAEVTRLVCPMKNVFGASVEWFVTTTKPAVEDKFVRTEYVNKDVVTTMLAKSMRHALMDSAEILAKKMECAVYVLIAKSLITELNAVAQAITPVTRLWNAKEKDYCATVFVRVMTAVTALPSVRTPRNARVAKSASMEVVDLCAHPDPSAPRDKYAPRAFAYPGATPTGTAETT